MRQITRNLFVLIVSAGLMVAASAAAVAQPQGGGGTITSGAATTPKPAAKTPAKKSVNKPVTPARPSPGPIATLDGKWWTTGNGFGDSEVVFTQTGSLVNGAIRYADGRTGTVTGKMVGKRLQHTWANSSGEGGSGWLELSWSNFLGGPWRNQKVRDGSWTLRRIEGKWCFGGSRSRIRSVTHDAQGRLTMVTEDGTRESGRLEGPWLFLHGDFGDIRGETDYKGTRVNWSTGFFWTWCGR
jgi:hypothetical protein